MTAFLENKRNFTSDFQPQVLYSYVGIIDQDKVHVIVSEIEQLLIAADIPKGQVKKTFTILVEGLQNMAIHSADTSGQRSIGLELVRVGENIGIHILGLADDKAVAKVKNAVDKLNLMDRAEIKSHYLNVMEHGVISAKGGAGLGLITMVMKSSGGMKIDSQTDCNGLHILSQTLEV
ncbi:MAG: hypothetical protein HKN45_06390 [Flavobacteriales bacterium]|nr:hypothetical protein [Flavobacteriales bacterium]